MGKYGGGIEKWREILENFSKEVYAGKYIKVNYEIWRNMKKAQTVNIDFEQLVSEGLIHIYYDGFTTVVSAYDHSLGEYLTKLAKETNTMSEYYTISTSSDLYTTNTGTNGITLNIPTYPAYGTACGSWYDYSNIDPATITNVVDEINKRNKMEEKENMNLFKGIEFGSCEKDNVKLSFYGIAVKNASGTYVAYDEKTGSIMDVDILNFSPKFLFKIPVAIKDISVGDTIIHNRKPVFVTRVEEGKLLAVDPAAGEEKIILPTKSPFGFDFAVKVVNLFNNFSTEATADSPFGNMLPLLALSDDASADSILPLLMLQGKTNINPMMLYFLMKDKNSDAPLLFYFMNEQGEICATDKLTIKNN